jgi:hypothetical protein
MAYKPLVLLSNTMKMQCIFPHDHKLKVIFFEQAKVSNSDLHVFSPFYGLSMLRPASKFAQQSGSGLPRWFHSTTTVSQVLKQKPLSSHGLPAKPDRQKHMQEATEEITTRISQDIPPRHGKLFLFKTVEVRFRRRARVSI